MCNYGWYQLDEIPCPHAITVLNSRNINKFDPYCLAYYTPHSIVKMYEVTIISMPDMKDWHASEFVENDEVLSPKYRRPSERPKKGRCKKSSETLYLNSNCCGRCGRKGHNRRRCDFFPKET